MTLTLGLNAERVVADYLRDHPDVAAITSSVVSKTPDNLDQPWVKYTQLAKPAVGGHRSDHFTEVTLQLDCYAGKTGGQPEASLLSRTVRAALVALNGEAEAEGATVTGALIRGDIRLPDASLNSRERFVITATIWMHP